VSPRNTAEPIEMLFGMFTGPRNHVLGGTLIPDIPGERAIFGGMSKPTENYWKYPARESYFLAAMLPVAVSTGAT